MPAIGILAIASNSGIPYADTGGNGMFGVATVRARSRSS